MTTPSDDMSTEDLRFMALALALGRRGLGRTWPNPAVGAVVVRDDGAGPVIVGRGWTQPGGRPHAETEALARAGEAARGATLYVTLEPCSHHGKTPPCADAIIKAGITRVVSAMADPNPQVAGAGHWRMAESGVIVEVGVGADEARRANAGHIRRMTDGRPHVILKLAVSADGKAGLAGRRPVQITGSAVRNRVHLMRAMSDAVLTGIGTALSDDPLLTCRLARHGRPLAGAGRARQSTCGCRSTAGWSRPRARCRCGWSPARARRRIASRRCGRAAPRCCASVGGRQARSRRGAASPGRARHHPADGRGRADRDGGIR